jgi:hypothetical protein
MFLEFVDKRGGGHNEVTSNNLRDFKLHKGLAVRNFQISLAS